MMQPQQLPRAGLHQHSVQRAAPVNMARQQSTGGLEASSSRVAAAFVATAAWAGARRSMKVRSRCQQGRCAVRHDRESPAWSRRGLLAAVAGTAADPAPSLAEETQQQVVAPSSEWLPLPGISLSQRLVSGAVLRNPREAGEEKAPAPCTYPGWLFGEWQLQVSPVTFAEPLGERFVDPETRKAIREDFTPTGKSPSGKRMSWRSRFYIPKQEELTGATEGAVVAQQQPALAQGQGQMMPILQLDSPVIQFRAFNAFQEMTAFLGPGAPPLITFADPRSRPLKVVMSFPVDIGPGEEGAPPVCSVQLRLDACQAEVFGRAAISSELFRQTVTFNGEVESVGDFEVITAYQSVSDEKVRARSRIVKYLVPGDKLYEEAAGGAVSLVDYDWDMRRLSTCIATPVGSQCLQYV